ncbi:MAG: CdaR family protein, partial [Erysipelotrichaceae bacterium]|nr:CdaR family protein [Erysipelotrichaceae bacterium]
KGELVDVDIFPETVTASVKVTTPMKEVPIVVKPVGELPDGNAIDSISLDHTTVTVYAPNSVLAGIDEIVVELDASKITKDSNWTYTLTVPSGVNSLSTTKVNIDVKIGKMTSRTIDGIVVNAQNNKNGYKIDYDKRDEMLSVTVSGTEKNISKITAEDIYIYVDLADVVIGSNQEVPIYISGTNRLVNYALSDGRTHIIVSAVK